MNNASPQQMQGNSIPNSAQNNNPNAIIPGGVPPQQQNAGAGNNAPGTGDNSGGAAVGNNSGGDGNAEGKQEWDRCFYSEVWWWCAEFHTPLALLREWLFWAGKVAFCGPIVVNQDMCYVFYLGTLMIALQCFDFLDGALELLIADNFCVYIV
jgi:hypothetical protein